MTTPVLRGPYKRGIERRRQVVATATEVFGEHGFRGGTLQQVADRVGGTPAAVLKLFGTKEKLLIAVLDHWGVMTREIVAQGTVENAYLDGFNRLMSYHVEHKGLLQLYTTIPPGQILYGSDMPYAPGVTSAFLFLRLATAAGLPQAALRSIAGEQLARIVAGEAPADLGPPVGGGALGDRVLEAERAAAYTSIALQLAWRGADPTEPLALAVSSCQRPARDGATEVLDAVAGLCRLALDAASRRPDRPLAVIPPALVAMALAGTPHAGAPSGLV